MRKNLDRVQCAHPPLSESCKKPYIQRTLMGTCMSQPTEWEGAMGSWRLQRETRSCGMGRVGATYVEFLSLGVFPEHYSKTSGRCSQASYLESWMGMKKRLRWKSRHKFSHWSSMAGRGISPFLYKTKSHLSQLHKNGRGVGTKMVVGEKKLYNENEQRVKNFIIENGGWKRAGLLGLQSSY